MTSDLGLHKQTYLLCVIVHQSVAIFCFPSRHIGWAFMESQYWMFHRILMFPVILDCYRNSASILGIDGYWSATWHWYIVPSTSYTLTIEIPPSQITRDPCTMRCRGGSSGRFWYNFLACISYFLQSNFELRW